MQNLIYNSNIIHMTPKQERFVQEYAKDFNAKQAAIRAGYPKAGAHTRAYRLLKKEEIVQAIRAVQQDHYDNSKITVERVLEEYAKIAFAEIGDYVEFKGRYIVIKDSKKIPKEKLAALGEVSETSQGIKVKLYDKKGALDSIARHLGMFNDSLEVKSDALTTLLEKIDGSTAKIK